MRELPLILALAGTEARELPVLARADVAFEVSEAALVRLAPERAREIALVGFAGEVRTLRLERAGDGERAALRGPLGELVLSDPTHSAIAFEPLERGRPDALFVASPRGVEVFEASAGALAREPRMLAPRAKLALRTGRPRRAPLAQDVNGDGRADLVVPAGEKLDVWIASGESQVFARAASVRVPRSSSRKTDASELSDVLRAALTIPSLVLRDVDGDARPDLVVEDGEMRAFHRVRASGAIPEAPDVELDLAIFRDTTPEAELRPGRTLAQDGGARYQSRDLDGDSIPDAVIAHRRKVWVFRASKAGPQFTEPSTILKTDDDITALTLFELDDDGRPDLVLLKVQVPSIAEILRGLIAEFSIDVDAVGYRNAGEGRFDREPAWRSTLTLRVPAILTLLKAPETWLARLEEAGKRFRRSAQGDFDGDGGGDIALVTVDGKALEVWRGAKHAGPGPAEADRLLRRVLFEDEERTWDFDRLVIWISTLGEERARGVTGARPPDARATLRDPARWRLDDLATGDLDGDGRDEIVLRSSPLEAEASGVRAAFEVLGW